MRRLIKSAVGTALHWCGVDRCVGVLSGSGHEPLILGYHRVVEDFAAQAARSIPSMLTSTATLERQLDWLGRRYRLAPLEEVAVQALHGARDGRPLAAVSFDDGYRDVYEHAFPLLRRKGIPFAVFVVTDQVGGEDPQQHDELYGLLRRLFPAWQFPGQELCALLRELDLPVPTSLADARDCFHACRLLLTGLHQGELSSLLAALRERAELPADERRALAPLSWEMLLEMQGAGVTVGSHTRRHTRLGHEVQWKLVDETGGSKRELEARLGREVRHFAYPDGDFDASAVAAVAAAGYRYAYTTCRHRDAARPALTLPRRSLWERSFLGAFDAFSPSLMSCHVNGVFDFRIRCAAHHGL